MQSAADCPLENEKANGRRTPIIERLKTWIYKEYPNNYKFYTIEGWDKCEIKPLIICRWNRKVKQGEQLSTVI